MLTARPAFSQRSHHHGPPRRSKKANESIDGASKKRIESIDGARNENDIEKHCSDLL
jgi:hypothetical protein